MKWVGLYRMWRNMELKEVKAQIKDYVRDHYKYYGWNPYDVQDGDTLYTY